MAKIRVVRRIFVQDIELIINDRYKIEYKDSYGDWVTVSGRLNSINENSLDMDTSKEFYATNVTIPLKEDKIGTIERL